MKAILEFTLPEDKEEFDLAHQGAQWQGVVVEVDNYLRDYLKYVLDAYEERTGEDPTAVRVVLQKTRDFLREELEDRGLLL